MDTDRYIMLPNSALQAAPQDRTRTNRLRGNVAVKIVDLAFHASMLDMLRSAGDFVLPAVV